MKNFLTILAILSVSYCQDTCDYTVTLDETNDSGNKAKVTVRSSEIGASQTICIDIAAGVECELYYTWAMKLLDYSDEDSTITSYFIRSDGSIWMDQDHKYYNWAPSCASWTAGHYYYKTGAGYVTGRNKIYFKNSQGVYNPSCPTESMAINADIWCNKVPGYWDSKNYNLIDPSPSCYGAGVCYEYGKPGHKYAPHPNQDERAHMALKNIARSFPTEFINGKYGHGVQFYDSDGCGESAACNIPYYWWSEANQAARWREYPNHGCGHSTCSNYCYLFDDCSFGSRAAKFEEFGPNTYPFNVFFSAEGIWGGNAGFGSGHCNAMFNCENRYLGVGQHESTVITYVYVKNGPEIDYPIPQGAHFDDRNKFVNFLRSDDKHLVFLSEFWGLGDERDLKYAEKMFLLFENGLHEMDLLYGDSGLGFYEFFAKIPQTCKAYAFVAKLTDGRLFRLPQDEKYFFGTSYSNKGKTVDKFYNCRENHYYFDEHSQSFIANGGPGVDVADIEVPSHPNDCQGCNSAFLLKDIDIERAINNGDYAGSSTTTTTSSTTSVEQENLFENCDVNAHIFEPARFYFFGRPNTQSSITNICLNVDERLSNSECSVYLVWSYVDNFKKNSGISVDYISESGEKKENVVQNAYGKSTYFSSVCKIFKKGYYGYKLQKISGSGLHKWTFKNNQQAQRTCDYSNGEFLGVKQDVKILVGGCVSKGSAALNNFNIEDYLAGTEEETIENKSKVKLSPVTLFLIGIFLAFVVVLVALCLVKAKRNKWNDEEKDEDLLYHQFPRKNKIQITTN